MPYQSTLGQTLGNLALGSGQRQGAYRQQQGDISANMWQTLGSAPASMYQFQQDIKDREADRAYREALANQSNAYAERLRGETLADQRGAARADLIAQVVNAGWDEKTNSYSRSAALQSPFYLDADNATKLEMRDGITKAATDNLEMLGKERSEENAVAQHITQGINPLMALPQNEQQAMWEHGGIRDGINAMLIDNELEAAPDDWETAKPLLEGYWTTGASYRDASAYWANPPAVDLQDAATQIEYFARFMAPFVDDEAKYNEAFLRISGNLSPENEAHVKSLGLGIYGPNTAKAIQGLIPTEGGSGGAQLAGGETGYIRSRLAEERAADPNFTPSPLWHQQVNAEWQKHMVDADVTPSMTNVSPDSRNDARRIYEEQFNSNDWMDVAFFQNSAGNMPLPEGTKLKEEQNYLGNQVVTKRVLVNDDDEETPASDADVHQLRQAVAELLQDQGRVSVGAISIDDEKKLQEALFKLWSDEAREAGTEPPEWTFENYMSFMSMPQNRLRLQELVPTLKHKNLETLLDWAALNEHNFPQLQLHRSGDVVFRGDR